jgi:hypothetical protein
VAAALPGRADRRLVIPSYRTLSIAIGVQAMRIPMSMIDPDPMADVSTVQIGWRWRKAVVGICRVAIALRWRCRFGRRW